MNLRMPVNGITALLVFLFVYAAAGKLMSLEALSRTLEALPLIQPGAGALAILLPLTELGVGLLLLFSRTRYSGLYASFVVLFTSYLGYMILYAPHLPCSCGGVISSLSWTEHIVFNGCFLVLNLIALFLYQKTFYRRSIVSDVEADGRVENA